MIVLSEEQLKPLEKQFGSDVRHMGQWNTDGAFGFCAVPISAVENAAEALQDPGMNTAVERLKTANDRSQPFVEILQAFGQPLVRKIAAAYRKQLALSYRRPRVRSAGEAA
jgi:hypothetical protein